MPFGVLFAALFFLGVCPVAAWPWLTASGWAPKALGALTVLLAWSILQDS